MDGKLIIRNHPNQHYRALFHQSTGFFVRKEEEGFPEPLWAMDGPELIDLSITSYCRRECRFCYRKSNSRYYLHMPLEDVTRVVEEANKCGTFQIALGGGNPNQHPEFEKILKLIRENDIIPSYTTNGDGLTDSVLTATAEYCGAMAVSVYPERGWNFYETLVKRIREYKIRLNLHAILNNETLDLWIKLLNDPPSFFNDINAIIFLNYKPSGHTRESLLPEDLEKVKHFFRSANNCRTVKIGFDSCSISGIVKWMDIPAIVAESCEAARFSCFIREDMKMFPCSFMAENDNGGDLRARPLIEIWRNNPVFKAFRNTTVPAKCSRCPHLPLCKGGCQLFPQINFCK